MENLNYTEEFPISQSSTCSLAVNPPTAQCVASNVHGPHESTTLCMESSVPDSTIICMESLDTDLSNANRRSGQVAITVEDARQDAPHVPFHAANPTHEQIHKYGGMLYLLYAGALVVMYPSLTQLAQLKFQNNKQSPFETHSFFANMAVVAYTIAIPASVILFAMKTHLESSIGEPSYPIYYIYMTLKIFFCFSGILAPLSLVLMLLVPHEFNWIGYLLILVLFIAIFAYKMILRKIKDASKFRTVQSNEIASHMVIVFLRMLAGFSKPSAEAIKSNSTVLDNVQWFEALEHKQGKSLPALEFMGLGRLLRGSDDISE
ncbi:ABC transporter I family member 1 [Tanacetum coccineum]